MTPRFFWIAFLLWLFVEWFLHAWLNLGCVYVWVLERCKAALRTGILAKWSRCSFLSKFILFCSASLVIHWWKNQVFYMQIKGKAIYRPAVASFCNTLLWNTKGDTGYILFQCLHIIGGQWNLVDVYLVKITVSLFCGKSCDQSSVNIASCRLKNKEYFHQNCTWMCLPDLENLTISIQIFCLISRSSIYHFQKKSTKFRPNWVLITVFGPKYTQFM